MMKIIISLACMAVALGAGNSKADGTRRNVRELIHILSSPRGEETLPVPIDVLPTLPHPEVVARELYNHISPVPQEDAENMIETIADNLRAIEEDEEQDYVEGLGPRAYRIARQAKKILMPGMNLAEAIFMIGAVDKVDKEQGWEFFFQSFENLKSHASESLASEQQRIDLLKAWTQYYISDPENDTVEDIESVEHLLALPIASDQWAQCFIALANTRDKGAFSTWALQIINSYTKEHKPHDVIFNLSRIAVEERALFPLHLLAFLNTTTYDAPQQLSHFAEQAIALLAKLPSSAWPFIFSIFQIFPETYETRVKTVEALKSIFNEPDCPLIQQRLSTNLDLYLQSGKNMLSLSDVVEITHENILSHREDEDSPPPNENLARSFVTLDGVKTNIHRAFNQVFEKIGTLFIQMDTSVRDIEEYIRSPGFPHSKRETILSAFKEIYGPKEDRGYDETTSLLEYAWPYIKQVGTPAVTRRWLENLTHDRSSMSLTMTPFSDLEGVDPHLKALSGYVQVLRTFMSDQNAAENLAEEVKYGASEAPENLQGIEMLITDHLKQQKAPTMPQMPGFNLLDDLVQSPVVVDKIRSAARIYWDSEQPLGPVVKRARLERED